MNITTTTIKSFLSSGQASNRSFRVLVKNRVTHQYADPDAEKDNQLNLMKNTFQNQNFQNAKTNLKKYIQNMKASSKPVSSKNQGNTNRSRYLPDISQKHPTSRINPFQDKKLINRPLTQSIDYNSENYSPNKKVGNSLGLSIDSKEKQQGVGVNSYNTLQNPQIKLFESNPNNNDLIQKQSTKQIKYDEIQRSERQRLNQLQNRVSFVLNERLRSLSSNLALSPQNQNYKANKLLQKQMDRLLDQIRRIKASDEDQFQKGESQKEMQINKNIEIFQKKVRILERLIAEKLFQSDNIKLQYLQKLKMKKRYLSERPFKGGSKSSLFYRQANNLNPLKYKQKQCKSPSGLDKMTTNRLSYQKPLKSYYINLKKDTFYNNNKLDQPLPRSTYNRQYLIYGQIPKELIRVNKSTNDQGVFSNFLSKNEQKNALLYSTYKQDFITKIQKDPINFKELDCYRDKLKSLQVNYGKEKNENKVVNNRSVNQYHDENKQEQANKSQTIQGHKCSGLQATDAGRAKSRIQEISSSISHLQKTSQKVSMQELEDIQQKHLFNQRIKSEIKHKNLTDLKYKFRKDLINEKGRLQKLILSSQQTGM